MGKKKENKKVKVEVEEIKLDEAPIEELKLEVIKLEEAPKEEKPESPVVLTNKKEEIPEAFISLKTAPKKKQMGFYKGRAYMPTTNGQAIWCDNGKSFEISSLR